MKFQPMNYPSSVKRDAVGFNADANVLELKYGNSECSRPFS
jgi:hypothetical protein